MLTITLDWLALTFKEFTNEAEQFISLYASSPQVETVSPRHGYSRGQADNNGVQLLWNPDRECMGHHVIFSGSALRNLWEFSGISTEALLCACVDAGGSISRLDLAKDATGETVDLRSIYQAIKQGNYSGNARKVAMMEGNDGGCTIYVGSRTSERFIRIYDKAAESQLQGELWFRLEVETKGMAARSTAIALRQSDNWAGVLDSLVHGMVDITTKTDLAKFFRDGNVPIGIPKIERHTNRERWIEDQVISAVARHWIDHPESAAIARLLDTLLLIRQQRAR